MALPQEDDLEQSLRRLVEGFESLSAEYRRLAEQHKVLESQLSPDQNHEPTTKQYSSDPAPVDIQVTAETHTPLDTIEEQPNLIDWLERIRGVDDVETKALINRIRDAGFAASRVRKAIENGRIWRSDDKRRTSPRRASSAKVPKAETRTHNPEEIEQDFTPAAKNPGQLGCPFVAPARNHNLPTPRSSLSHQRGPGKADKKSSLNDPIKHGSSAAGAASEDENAGPACPIRFLGQHSPEDVAKYFEEHKHELPRSHALCVQRFQSNTDSIRKLDEKYGNLVTMIQGLGQKHQAMLPDVPNEAEMKEVKAVEEEQKSTRRVKKWADAVSESQPSGNVEEGKIPDASFGSEGEERVAHFDRPLKEIRVGESPSRPWGVPIPSKYLDKAKGSDNDSGVAESLPAPVPGDDRPLPQLPDDKPIVQATEKQAVNPPPQAPIETAENSDGQAKGQTKGRCPFDHTAMSGDKLGERAKDDVAAQTVPEATSVEADSAAKESGRNQTTPKIVNHGTAVVRGATNLEGIVFENHGTLILGYKSDNAQGLIPRLSQ